MVTEEEKIIICCTQYTGTLRGLEERARLAMCCKGTPLDPELAREAVEGATVANEHLSLILHKLVHGTEDSD